MHLERPIRRLFLVLVKGANSTSRTLSIASFFQD